MSRITRYEDLVRKFDCYVRGRRWRITASIVVLLLGFWSWLALFTVQRFDLMPTMTTGQMFFRWWVALFATVTAGIALLFVASRGGFPLLSVIREGRAPLQVVDLMRLLGVPAVLGVIGVGYLEYGAPALLDRWYESDVVRFNLGNFVAFPPTPAMVEVGRIVAQGAVSLAGILIVGRLVLLAFARHSLFVARTLDGTEKSCPGCRYDLQALRADTRGIRVCPECGCGVEEPRSS